VDAISYSNARKNLVKTMEYVCDTHDPVIITRKNASSVVLISLDDFNAMQETDYLLRHPANAAHLRASIKQYEEGKFKQKDMIDDKDDEADVD
jgi:antitoxin YefM